MEFNLIKTPVGILAKALDAVSEQPIDIDFTLPDYCPDIEKILRCKITPNIYNRNLSGGQLQVDGTTVVNILYTDAKNNVRACEQSIPFNAAFPLKEIPDNPVIETYTKLEYLNCRPLSPRRLTVHGAFSLYAVVKYIGKADIFSPDTDSKLEFNTKKIQVSALECLCQEQFSAGDEIQIVNKPPVEVILDSDVRAVITDYKIIPDKLMLNGELNVRLLYLSSVDSPEVQQADCSIPFSKILDCSGLTADYETSVKLSLLSCEIRLKNDILSETPVVNVDGRLSLSAASYGEKEAEIILDAYSTEFPVELDSAVLSVITDTKVIEDSFMYKDSVSLPDCDLAEITDFNVNYSLVSTAVSESKITLNSKLNVCILALNSDKEPFYAERAVEFSKELDCGGFNEVSSAYAQINSVSYRIAENGEIELRCEIRYLVTADKTESFKVITAISADEDKKVIKRNTPLVLYYADKGERLWDIAKSFNTGKSLISEENNLGDDILQEAKMLLIPIM